MNTKKEGAVQSSSIWKPPMAPPPILMPPPMPLPPIPPMPPPMPPPPLRLWYLRDVADTSQITESRAAKCLPTVSSANCNCCNCQTCAIQRIQRRATDVVVDGFEMGQLKCISLSERCKCCGGQVLGSCVCVSCGCQHFGEAFNPLIKQTWVT